MQPATRMALRCSWHDPGTGHLGRGRTRAGDRTVGLGGEGVTSEETPERIWGLMEAIGVRCDGRGSVQSS